VVVGFHQSSSLVVFAVPCDFCGSFAVEAQEKPSSPTHGDPFIFPHHPRHIVSATKLVAETVASDIQKHSTDTSQCLRSEELDLRIWLIRVDKTSWVHLHPFQIHSLRTNCHGHFEPITSAMLSICCWQMGQIWAILVK